MEVYRQLVGPVVEAPVRTAIDLIAVGGLASAADVWRAISFDGASVTQQYTEMILPDSSTPNFFYYQARDLLNMIDKVGLTLAQLRGSRIPVPNDWQRPIYNPGSRW